MGMMGYDGMNDGTAPQTFESRDMNELVNQSISTELDNACGETQKGTEFWRARDLQKILRYVDWRNFFGVIEKAREGFRKIGSDPDNQIVETTILMGRGKGSQVKVVDFFLTRTACYLIAMNGDSGNPYIAAAQAYFAVQTRRQELSDQASDDDKRIALRAEARESFKRLSKTAQEAGVRNIMQPVFHDAGYRGMYSRSLKDILKYKGLDAAEKLLDRAGPLELAANNFRMALADNVISTHGIRGEQNAISTHREVGVEVRETMKKSQGTLPEDLPVESDIKKIERQRRPARISSDK